MARAEEERGEEEEEEGEWVPVVERALKSTVVGGLLIPLLVVIGDRRVCTLTMANLLQKSLHPLVQLVAQVRVMNIHSVAFTLAIRIGPEWSLLSSTVYLYTDFSLFLQHRAIHTLNRIVEICCAFICIRVCITDTSKAKTPHLERDMC